MDTDDDDDDDDNDDIYHNKEITPNMSKLSLTDICMHKSRTVNPKAELSSHAANSNHTTSNLLLSVPGCSNDRNCELT